MRGVAEQRREAGRGVEARQAEPVDRAVAADQRSRLRVADDGVVFDGQAHGDVGGAPGGAADRRRKRTCRLLAGGRSRSCRGTTWSSSRRTAARRTAPGPGAFIEKTREPESSAGMNERARRPRRAGRSAEPTCLTETVRLFMGSGGLSTRRAGAAARDSAMRHKRKLPTWHNSMPGALRCCARHSAARHPCASHVGSPPC